MLFGLNSSFTRGSLSGIYTGDFTALFEGHVHPAQDHFSGIVSECLSPVSDSWTFIAMSPLPS